MTNPALASPRPGVLGETDDRLKFIDDDSYYRDLQIDELIHFRNLPSLELDLSATESISNNSITDVPWDAINWSAGPKQSGRKGVSWDDTTNTERITCNEAGLYFVACQIDWAFHATGVRTVRLRKNGTEIAKARDTAMAATSGNGQSFGKYHWADAGDYFTVAVYQNSGGNLNVETTSWFQVVRQHRVVNLTT